MDIIVDTREQRPLWVNNVIRYGLLVGDYTSMKLRDSFAIERKSPMDLYGSIIQGHVRFRNEMIRAEVNGIKLVVVVECSKRSFVNKSFKGADRLQCEGETLRKIIETIEKRYKLELIWCCGRRGAKEIILKRLRKEENKLKRFNLYQNDRSKKELHNPQSKKNR